MKIVFPNSAWVMARERLALKGGRLEKIAFKVRYGVIIHPEFGPVLMDTGYTPEVVSAPGRGRMLRAYTRILKPAMNAAEQPEVVLAHLGYSLADVRFVIVTHLHADHISGLRQFPNARFIVAGATLEHILSSSALKNLRHVVFTELLPDDFSERLIVLRDLPEVETGYGLPKGRDIFRDGRAIAVGLEGHANGHFGVLFPLRPSPLLYAVDVQWLKRGLSENRMPGWPSRLIIDDFAAYKHSGALVVRYMEQGHEALFCHDPETTPYDYLPEAKA